MDRNRNIHEASAEKLGASPWTASQRLKQFLWQIAWTLLCVWTPKPMNRWRLFILKCFGAKIHGRPFVHQRARIQIPWHLTLHDRACLGDRANVYTLGEIEIGAGATVAQEAYLSSGTHDFTHPNRPLLTAKITIGADCFIGARAFIMPGITIGQGTVVGAMSVATKDLPPKVFAVGNPCQVLRDNPESKQEAT